MLRKLQMPAKALSNYSHVSLAFSCRSTSIRGLVLGAASPLLSHIPTKQQV